MAELKQVQQMKLTIPADVINGFCWPFARGLTDKLKELAAGGMVFSATQRFEGTPNEDSRQDLSEMGRTVMQYLEEQLQLNGVFQSHGQCSVNQVNGLIAIAEEFLTIFVQQEKA